MESEGKPRKPYSQMSLIDFQAKFPSEKACWDYVFQMRWKDGPSCRCTSKKLDLIHKRRVFECRKCGRQISVTAGTIFHKSRTPLRKWFWAIFLMATSKKGVPMLYLQKQLGIKSYRTAWMMGHKIRRAMMEREELYTLTGTIQTDEIFIGQKQSLENRKKFSKNKTPFLMMVSESEDGQKPRFLKLKELEDITAEFVIPAIELGVEPGSLLKTDGAVTYFSTRAKGYGLKQSSYSQNPEATLEHLNWLNTLTSNLKRFLISTYHGVFPKYRRAYLAEFAYRFNRRYWPEEAFDRLLFACINAAPKTLPELRA